jgi:hypothetical protein
MPEILNLLALLLPAYFWSINRENLPKRVKRKRATLTVAGKKKKNVTKGCCSKLGLLLRQS